VQVALVWVCVLAYGLKGTGIAFFGGYVFYGFLIYAIVRRLSGFRWTAANKQVGLLYGVLIAAVFVGECFLSPALMTVLGAGVTLLAGIYSLKKICALIPLERLPGQAQRVIVLLRLAPNLRHFRATTK
jgi:PST family polysaccharide transporter